ncbi:phage head closure protein [Jeongeupia naejangsanensis]|uniref:Phage head closure protein n=1 Tax=Jeongeupia naejangsanensis TaxID=613195 RepID=A0ABS2BG10_9NEIS|nr:phage head closure protein [Jeongeupia naejangsanensis]MBM3114554.1 phage head closure protein [Jeongeupia naejangsanensis]
MGNLNKYRSRVRIEQLQSPRDSVGGELKVWVPLADTDLPARIRPLRGREFLATQQVQAEVTTEISLRYPRQLPTITAAMRVRCGSTLYNIKAAIDIDGRQIDLQLMCTSGVDEG